MSKFLSKGIKFVPGFLALSPINNVYAAPNIIEAITAKETVSSLKKINQYAQLIYTEEWETSVAQLSLVAKLNSELPSTSPEELNILEWATSGVEINTEESLIAVNQLSSEEVGTSLVQLDTIEPLTLVAKLNSELPATSVTQLDTQESLIAVNQLSSEELVTTLPQLDTIEPLTLVAKLNSELPYTSVTEISEISFSDRRFPKVELISDRYCLSQSTDNVNKVQAGYQLNEEQDNPQESDISDSYSDMAVSNCEPSSIVTEENTFYREAEILSKSKQASLNTQLELGSTDLKVVASPTQAALYSLQPQEGVSCNTNELAVSWASCLVPLKEMIANDSADSVPKNQFAAIKSSESIFPAQLPSVRGGIQDLKLEIDTFQLNQISSRRGIGFSENNPSFRSRQRLSYRTSFSEGDSLRVRWRPEDYHSFWDTTKIDLPHVEFDRNNNDNRNTLEFNSLEYRLDIARGAKLYIQALGGGIDDFAQELHLDLGDTISDFAGGNPIIEKDGEKGIGLVYDVSEDIRLGVGHTIEDVYDGNTSIGSAASGTIVNLAFTPGDVVGLGLTYVRSFNNIDTGTGSERANEPFDGDTDSLVANSYGMELNFNLNSDVTIGGWVGLTQAVAKDLPNDPKANIFNYAIALTWDNIGHKDNMAGIVIGQPPKVISNDFEDNVDTDTSLHLESFFTFKATENLTITPSLLIITNPEHDQSNDTTYVGTIQINWNF